MESEFTSTCGDDTDEHGTTAAQPYAVASVELPNVALISTTPKPTTLKNPLLKFSLLGRADEIEANAADTKPLLGEFLMRGQATMLYAEPNTGKTLLAVRLCLDAIETDRIEAQNLIYINADDNSQGLASKLRLMQDAGAHMIAPGFENFRTDDLITSLIKGAQDGTARGTCVVIDTLKKFSDLMDKKRTSEFAKVCRQYVMAGGTIVALGHTTKNPNSDGTPRYQGTTDIMEDFDAVYVAQPLTRRENASHRVVKLSRLKCRADSPETVAYAYDTDAGLSYEAMLASVRPVDIDDLDGYAPERQQMNDPVVMGAIVRLIQAGSTDGKMAIAKAVAKECGQSQRQVIEVLDRLTGDTPNEHLWNVQIGPRGVRCYRLIEQAKGDT